MTWKMSKLAAKVQLCCRLHPPLQPLLISAQLLAEMDKVKLLASNSALELDQFLQTQAHLT
jgi:hypothetical protein